MAVRKEAYRRGGLEYLTQVMDDEQWMDNWYAEHERARPER